MMTLREIEERCYTVSEKAEAKTAIYVLDSEPDGCGEQALRECEIFCTIKSHYKGECYLQEKVLNAEVTHIYAIGLDEIYVVIDLDK